MELEANESILAPKDIDQYERGYWDGLTEYQPGQKTGEPVSENDDYLFGFWVGVGGAMAWHEGYAAAERGMMVCPYSVGADDECFREDWFLGYAQASFANDRKLFDA